jgi:hypothetical protein
MFDMSSKAQIDERARAVSLGCMPVFGHGDRHERAFVLAVELDVDPDRAYEKVATPSRGRRRRLRRSVRHRPSARARPDERPAAPAFRQRRHRASRQTKTGDIAIVFGTGFAHVHIQADLSIRSLGRTDGKTPDKATETP